MNQDFQICTVVQGEDLTSFVQNLEKAQKSATMVELRADSIRGFSADDLPILKGVVKVPSIFTLRHKKEGGLFTGTPAKQKQILQEAFSSGFTYVDIAYRNPILKELSPKHKKHLLLSYHEYQETPDLEDLLDTLDEMRAIKPAIIKIATFVDDHEDVLVLGILLKQKEDDEKMIVIGMGKKGEITRFTFPTLGSYITYVTMKGEKNIAPGMLTEADLLKKVESHLKHPSRYSDKL